METVDAGRSVKEINKKNNVSDDGVFGSDQMIGK